MVAPASQYCAVHIQGDGAPLEFVKKPTLAAALYPGGAALIKTLKQARDGLVAWGFASAEQTHQGAVQTGDVGVGKARGPAPDTDNHLFDELLWAVPPIGAGLR